MKRFFCALLLGLSLASSARAAINYPPIFSYSGTQSPIVNLYSAQPPNNYTGLSGAGPIFSYTPWTGGNGTDLVRAANYMRMASVAGLEHGETTLALDAYLNSGYAPAWAASQSVATGAETIANGNLYKATTGGTTASSGGGPSGTGTAIADGSVTWSYVAASSIDPGKVNLSLTTAVGPQASQSWGAAFNYILLPGWASNFGAGIELDYGNLSGRDCFPGGSCNAYGIFQSGYTSFSGTVAHSIANTTNIPIVDNPPAWVAGQTVAAGTVVQNGGHAYKATTGGTTASGGSGPVGTPASQADGSVTWAYYGEVYLGRTGGQWHDGVAFQGPNVVANHDINFSDGAQIALWGSSGTSHSVAFLQDQSNSPASLDLQGLKSYAAINEHTGTQASPTPFGILQSGTYSGSAYRYQDLLIGQWGGNTAYSAISFNDTLSTGSINGFFGKNGDSNLYGNTQGSYHFRVGNVDTAIVAANGLSTSQHFYGTGTAPTISASAGTPTLSAGANDNHGTVTNGSTAGATVTLTWASPRTNPGDCIVQNIGAGTLTRTVPTTTGFQMTFSAAGGQATYICMGQ